ncbi:MAG TPA: imidazolonepropionase [Phycisphaerales bacterium]|nr:imidazolonepropionase [Phycisphaerales bacterium]
MTHSSPPPLLIHNARVLTLTGETPRRGASMGDLGVLDRADVLVENGRVARVECSGSERKKNDRRDACPTGTVEIDADGRVLMPAFIDAHTHACWAGERLDEWEMKLRGASYLDLLKAGGGIMATVRAVRSATEDELADALAERLGWMLREGTTAAEVKSGYGLTTGDELKMLRAARRAGEAWPGRVFPTACIGHAIDKSQDGFVERTIAETLPAVHAEFPGIPIDAYCEDGAWSLDETVRLFEAASALGHPIRVHADQFNSLGMIPEALRLGALSVDHLEASTPGELDMLAASDTFGVMLPCSGFHTDGRYADGRRFIDAGGKLVIATNANPGSAPCFSIPMAIALAVRSLGISAAEAICACTTNAAALLGLDDAGRIEPGMRADLVLLRVRDERELGHTFGGNPVELTLVGGARVSR